MVVGTVVCIPGCRLRLPRNESIDFKGGIHFVHDAARLHVTFIEEKLIYEPFEPCVKCHPGSLMRRIKHGCRFRPTVSGTPAVPHDKRR